jgi:hypothetical protein
MGRSTTPKPEDQAGTAPAEVDPDQLSIGDALADTETPAPADETPAPADETPAPADEIADDVWWAEDDLMPEDYKVGDTVDLPRAGMVRLPDGTVVTARTHYTARHRGTHAFIATIDGKAVEAEFEVR